MRISVTYPKYVNRDISSPIRRTTAANCELRTSFLESNLKFSFIVVIEQLQEMTAKFILVIFFILVEKAVAIIAESNSKLSFLSSMQYSGSTSPPTQSHSRSPSIIISPQKSPSISISIHPTISKSKQPTSSRPDFGTPTHSSTPVPSKHFPTIIHASSNPTKGPIYSSALPTDKPVRTTSMVSKAPSLRPTRVPSKSSTRPSQFSAHAHTPSTTFSPTLSPTAPKEIEYHNGTVMTGPVNLYIIYFGRFDPIRDKIASPTAMKSLMENFAANFSTLSWFGVLGDYYQYQDGIKTAATNRTQFIKSVSYRPGAYALSISYSDIINCINETISIGKLPLDPHGIYTVIFRGDFQFDGWMSKWCGYHQSVVLNGVPIKFAAIGDPSTTSSFEHPTDGSSINLECSGAAPPTVNGNFGADSMVSVLVHELAEIITDWNGDAWHGVVDATDDDGAGEEIGDLCSWKFQGYNATGKYNAMIGDKKVLVQAIFQRGVGCVMERHKQ